jgi:hypothetical protein
MRVDSGGLLLAVSGQPHLQLCGPGTTLPVLYAPATAGRPYWALSAGTAPRK